MAKPGLCVECKGKVASGGNQHRKGGCSTVPTEKREELEVSRGSVVIEHGRKQLTPQEMELEARTRSTRPSWNDRW